MTFQPESDQVLLIRALVERHHQRQYDSDVYFRHAIDTLARLLPVWIMGLASEGELHAQDRAEQYERLAGSSRPTNWPFHHEDA